MRLKEIWFETYLFFERCPVLIPEPIYIVALTKWSLCYDTLHLASKREPAGRILQEI